MPICWYLGWRSPYSGDSWAVAGVGAEIVSPSGAKVRVLEPGSRVHASPWNCRAAAVLRNQRRAALLPLGLGLRLLPGPRSNGVQ